MHCRKQQRTREAAGDEVPARGVNRGKAGAGCSAFPLLAA